MITASSLSVPAGSVAPQTEERPLNFRRMALCTLLPIFITAILFFVPMFIYDPLMVFHKPWGRPITVYENLREQNLGLIKQSRFDSVILGNSLTANSSARLAGLFFGGTFMNLSIDGGSLFEQKVLIDYLMRTREIKTVICPLSVLLVRDGYGGYTTDRWAFLYDRNPLNDFKVYMNKRFVTCMLRWSDAPECVGKPVDLDTPGVWDDDPWHTERFGGVENWIRHNKHPQLLNIIHKELPEAAALEAPARQESQAGAEQDIKDYLRDFVVSPAKEYPHTRFLFFFSPNPRLFQSVQYTKGAYSYYTTWVRNAVEMCASLSNVEIFGFDNEPFVDDIAQYKDEGHYNRNVNNAIMEAMSKGRNKLTPDNVEAYLKEAEYKAASFDLKGFNQYIQEQITRLPR